MPLRCLEHSVGFGQRGGERFFDQQMSAVRSYPFHPETVTRRSRAEHSQIRAAGLHAFSVIDEYFFRWQMKLLRKVAEPRRIGVADAGQFDAGVGACDPEQVNQMEMLSDEADHFPGSAFFHAEN